MKSNLFRQIFYGSILGFSPIFILRSVQEVIGYSTRSEILYMLSIQVALLLGFLPLFRSINLKWVRFFSGLSLIIYSIFWSDSILISAQSNIHKTIFLIFLFFQLAILFKTISLSLYNGEGQIGRRYSSLHFVALVVFILGTFSLQYLPIYFFGLILGALSVLTTIFCNNLQQEDFIPWENYILEKDTIFFVGLVVIMTMIQLSLFRFSSVFIRPTSYEMPVWQVLSFFGLGVSHFLADKLDLKKIFWLQVAIALLPGLFIIFTPTSLLFELADWRPIIFGALCSLSFLCSSPLVLIYERRFPGRPWLWFLVFGQLFSFILSMILFHLFKWPLVLQISLTLLFIFCSLHIMKSKFFVTAMMGCLISVYYYFHYFGEHEIANLTIQFQARPGTYNSSKQFELKSYSYGIHGEAKLGEVNGVNYLFLDGYASVIKGYREIHQIAFLEQAIENGARRVVILGLGNGRILSGLQKMFKRAGVKNYHVDIIENFSPLLEQMFLQKLSQVSGFTMVDASVSIKQTDAFEFLQRREKKYDIVVWNLSQPWTPQTNRLYTAEAFLSVSEILNPNGWFVSYVDNEMVKNEKLICLYKEIFKDSKFFPTLTKSQTQIRLVFVSGPGVSQWPNMDHLQKMLNCQAKDRLTLNSMGQLRSLGHYQKLTPQTYPIIPQLSTDSYFNLGLKMSYEQIYRKNIFTDEIVNVFDDK